MKSMIFHKKLPNFTQFSDSWKIEFLFPPPNLSYGCSIWFFFKRVINWKKWKTSLSPPKAPPMSGLKNIDLQLPLTKIDLLASFVKICSVLTIATDPFADFQREWYYAPKKCKANLSLSWLKNIMKLHCSYVIIVFWVKIPKHVHRWFHLGKIPLAFLKWKDDNISCHHADKSWMLIW